MTLSAVIAVIVIAMPVIALVTVPTSESRWILYFWIARRARDAGATNLDYSIRTARRITEMVGAMKELTLRNKNAEVEAVVNDRHCDMPRARAIVLIS